MFLKFFTDSISNQAPASNRPLVGMRSIRRRPFAINLTMNSWARKDIHCEERVSEDCLQRHYLEDENRAVRVSMKSYGQAGIHRKCRAIAGVGARSDRADPTSRFCLYR